MSDDPERGAKPHGLLELGAGRFAERPSGSGSTVVAGAPVQSTPSVPRAVFLSHTSRCLTMRKWPTPTTATGQGRGYRGGVANAKRPDAVLAGGLLVLHTGGFSPCQKGRPGISLHVCTWGWLFDFLHGNWDQEGDCKATRPKAMRRGCNGNMASARGGPVVLHDRGCSP